MNGTQQGDVLEPIELPIQPGCGLEIEAPSWRKTSSHAALLEVLSYTITGPPAAKALLEREAASTSVGGFLSPPHRITIKGERARLAGIPQAAAFYSFAYPLECLAGRYHRLVDEERIAEPWLFFLLLGGFCYFDANHEILQTNAFVMTPTQHKLILAGPLNPSKQAVAAMRRASRLRPITLEPLRAQGFERLAWIVSPPVRPTLGAHAHPSTPLDTPC